MIKWHGLISFTIYSRTLRNLLKELVFMLYKHANVGKMSTFKLTLNCENAMPFYLFIIKKTRGF